MLRILVGTILFFSPVTALWCQELIPPIVNHSTSVYGAENQNWGISSDEDGIIYVANNEGLLRYDGQRWESYRLPNKTIIRSVLYQDGKVYIGSYEEFGYWSNNAIGTLQYTSLTHLIPAPFADEEFWQIMAFGDQIAFRSFGKLYLYNGHSIAAFRPEFLINSMIVKGDELLVGSNSKQVFKFSDGKFDAVSKNAPGTDAINTLVAIEDKFILGTKLDGIFTLENGLLVPWPDQKLNDFLINNELNKLLLHDNKLVCGTIQGGVAIYDLSSGKLQNLNRESGLQNNTVLSVHESNNRLWLGLDNGIDELSLNASTQFYIDKSGELGAVYDMAVLNDRIYVGTNTGVHYFENGKRYFINGSQGQVWSFITIDERLYVNHNEGVYEIDNNMFNPVSERTGSYKLVNYPGSSFYFDATYNGIRIYNYTQGTLMDRGPLKHSPSAVQDIIFEDNQTLWATHPYKGLYRIELLNDSLNTKNINSFGADSLFTAYRSKIHKIENQIAFDNGGKWFVYNAINQSIEPFEELQIYNGYGLLSSSKSGYWFKNRNGKGLVYTDFSKDSLSVYEPLLESRIIKNYDKLIPFKNEQFFATLNEGFAVIDLGHLREQHTTRDLPEPLLMSLNDDDGRHDLSSETFKIENLNSGTLEIWVASPQLDNPNFMYELSNGQKGVSPQGHLIFQNLKAGDYTLKVYPKVMGSSGKNPLIVNFKILVPWYEKGYMLALYVLATGIIILLVYYTNRRKLNKHRLELEQKLKKEQERKTQIDEHNKLLDEINRKRKELANSTYLAAKRNRILSEISTELEKMRGGFDKYKYKNIQNKINLIIDGKDNWKVFETNFNEINDDFFHDLLKSYPNLSTKDLKLCAYLKMNLSTKEIAPLMAISVRGVEIHRYRLRKKLDLPKGRNLSKFLIKNY